MDKSQLLAEFLKTGAGAAAKMNPVTGLVSLAPSIFQGVAGAVQASKAKKIEAANIRPIMQVPSEINEATTIARNAYLDPALAGQAQAEGRLGTTVANTIDAAKQIGSGGAGQLQAVAAAELGRQQGLGDIQARSEQQQVADALAYQNALRAQAPYSLQVWDYNTRQPYEQAADTASALRQAANENINTAISNVATAAINTDFSGKNKPMAKAGSSGIASAFDPRRMAPPASTPVTAPAAQSPAISLNPDGSFPVELLKKNTVSMKSRVEPPPAIAPMTTAMPTANIPMREQIPVSSTSPMPDPRFARLNEKLGFDASYLARPPKAPKGSLYGDDLYEKLPILQYGKY